MSQEIPQLPKPQPLQSQQPGQPSPGQLQVSKLGQSDIFYPNNMPFLATSNKNKALSLQGQQPGQPLTG